MNLPSRMRAAVLYGPGAPDAFVLEELPVPECGPGEVVVQVAACGVSFRDVVERNGTYKRDSVFPVVIGLEIAGIVRAVGGEVRHLRVGDRVCSKAFSSCGFCNLCRTGRESTCLNRRAVRGGYAEYVAQPEDAFVPIGDQIPFEYACTLGPAIGVAMNAVRDVARVQPGDIVLVTGATGGVGWPAMQLAKLSGATVLAVTRDARHVTDLRGGGADEVVVIQDGKFASEVKRITEGRGADVVIDNVGSRVFQECFNSLALHGRYAVVGQLFGEEVSINLARIFFKRAQLLGVGSVSRVQVADSAALVAAGRLTPRVSRILSLEQVAEAHASVENGTTSGRIVLTPNHSLLQMKEQHV